jgi:hypothetical protein
MPRDLRTGHLSSLQSEAIELHSARSFSFISCSTTTCFCWLILATTLVTSGATCARRQVIPEFAPPVLYSTTPTLPELTEQLNRSLAIQQLESQTMTITSPALMAKLSGSLAWERPHNFSLQAYPGMKAMGLAFAAGSNSNEFWLQQQMGGPPTLYYASHNDFNQQTGPRHMLPVSPLWLREALGVVELDPAMQHFGPRAVPGPDNKNKLIVETHIPTARGPYRRLLVLDAQTGMIEETRLYDAVGPEGKMVAMAQQSKHQLYSAVNWYLPHKVDIQLLPDEGEPLAFSVEIEFYMVNESASTDPAAFRMPDPSGLTTVNIAAGPGLAQAAKPVPPNYTQVRPSGQGSLTGFRVVR